jgi:ATP-dependent Clp protease adaptor protein ClpS
MFKLSQDNDNDSTSSDLGAVVLEKEPEVKEPPSYQVVLINDDYTPMEFVVFVPTHRQSNKKIRPTRTKKYK